MGEEREEEVGEGGRERRRGREGGREGERKSKVNYDQKDRERLTLLARGWKEG